MAFTEQNKADAYLFFVLAFNAAPGTVYGGQIVEAYESGMTTADIVAEYVTKDAFKAIYPDSQTNAQFAAALVKNVASAKNPTAVNAAAVADIEKALAAGWTKAQVITQIIGNLANKTVADAEWGQTVAQLNNKIAVAKALTEGDKALNTTDAALLQGPLKGVTEDIATVKKALDAAGDLASKLDTLAAAKAAASDFIAQVKAELKADDVPDLAAAKTKLTAQADTAENAIKEGGLDDDAATKAAQIQVAVATANAAQKTASKALNDFQAAAAKLVNKDGETLLAVLNAAKSAKDKVAAAETANALAANVTVKALSDINVKADASYEVPESVDGYAAAVIKAGEATIAKFNTTKKVFEFDAAATPEQKALFQPLVNAADAQYLTQKALEDAEVVHAKYLAEDGKVVTFAPSEESLQWDDVFKGEDAPNNGADANVKLGTLANGFKVANEEITTLNKNIAIVNGVDGKLAQIATLQQNIDNANKAFTEAGYNVPVEVKGTDTLFATTGDDVYLTTKDTKAATLYDFGGKDVIYVGKGYELNASGDLTKGDNSSLEVFFKANGASTDVYIEQKAFGSSVANAAQTTGDIVKVTLTGVSADKLAFEDGFITLA